MERATSVLPEGTYVELVRSLFATLLPTAIMALSFLGIGALLDFQTGDPPLIALTATGVTASLSRLAVILIYRRQAESDALSAKRARQLERCFAIAYFSFAVILGAFGARGFLVAAPDARMLITGLLFGYGAGVAAGLSLRPRISVPSILVAIVPTILTAWSTLNVSAVAVGLLLAVFLAGGIESMLRRYRDVIAKISMRQTFSTLARLDHLTGLPNRLALRERFDECMAISDPDGGRPIAVHCLDLDRFKPVNDRHGHPVGDALLCAVSKRLGQSLRGADFAARIGGDEFVVVQGGMGHEGEAELLAHRIVRLIAEPFSIDGHTIKIGTSVGYAIAARRSADMDHLIACADEALCRVKQQGGGVAAHEGQCSKTLPFRAAAAAG